jgi:hypothetical protein
MFLCTASIDAHLADRARLELEDHNKALVRKTSESWPSISWVPLAYHAGMGDTMFACREFQKVGNEFTPMGVKIERWSKLTPPKIYEGTARGVMIKWERTLLCTSNSSSALPEMDGDGGWLVLGSLSNIDRPSLDLGQAFLWGAGDNYLHAPGVSGTIYATFSVSYGRPE